MVLLFFILTQLFRSTVSEDLNHHSLQGATKEIMEDHDVDATNLPPG